MYDVRVLNHVPYGTLHNYCKFLDSVSTYILAFPTHKVQRHLQYDMTTWLNLEWTVIYIFRRMLNIQFVENYFVLPVLITKTLTLAFKKLTLLCQNAH